MTEQKETTFDIEEEFEKVPEYKQALKPNKLASSISRTIGPRAGSIIKFLNNVSDVNYYTDISQYALASVANLLKRRSVNFQYLERFVPNVEIDPNNIIKQKAELIEKFPVNMTSLMNEDNKWGCFYNYPQLYEDHYAPVVGIRELRDVPEPEKGILNRDMVTACLTYLRHTPILGDYTCIKLDLSKKHLTNIDVLKHYKYLVYLDLSSNMLKDLTVLSHLPYLQYISVSFNNLSSILEYDTPQWFLTEVHYKYNAIKKINDLSVYWSLTVLDLSHNNIKSISGLDQLRYLRRLDLSFNHIQRLENLNHLRLLWLDVSYNNISTFELGENTGLWTLLHLEYLNLNENSLTTMKMFTSCSRLRELYIRNNRFSVLLELALYMKEMRSLTILDMRSNSLCSMPGYKEVVINTFPLLLSLDAEVLEPMEQRTLKMNMFPDITVHATRRLLRLLYIQQLSRAMVSPFVPPADTTDVPLVIIVGHEGVGKGTLVRRLVAQCSSNIECARLHTTALHHFPNHFIEVTKKNFDEMLLSGDMLTYTEMDGESYGLSRKEAYVTDGKVKILSMDLLGALMLKLRGYRPYLILATLQDVIMLEQIQYRRRIARDSFYKHHYSDSAGEHTTLQVLLSGRIIINGILNEILMGLPDEKVQSGFILESECSLLMDSDQRKEDNRPVKENLMTLLGSITARNNTKNAQDETSLYSLFKESQTTEEYASVGDPGSYQSGSKRTSRMLSHKLSANHGKSVEFGDLNRISAGKVSGSKSSKSVTFTWQDAAETSGMLIESEQEKKDEQAIRSVSVNPWVSPGQHHHRSTCSAAANSDLWLAFLTEARQQQASELDLISAEIVTPKGKAANRDRYSIMDNQLQPTKTIKETIENLETMETLTRAHMREDYENIHRRTPGLFWDAVIMDNPNKAFQKTRNIIRDIVASQKQLKPMFDIDFAKLSNHPAVQEKINSIRKEIAPEQLFY